MKPRTGRPSLARRAHAIQAAKVGAGGLADQAVRGRRANAEPAGGGGGAFRAVNEKAARNRAKLREAAAGRELRDSPGGLTIGAVPDYGSERGAPPASGTSIFDPVLCELLIRWFCPPGGTILDPFAGGSVRGIVASHLGRPYVGIDLRPEQIAANRAQIAIAKPDVPPAWIEGDARELSRLCADIEADFILSCPPYGDLERYSDDPRDLSTMAYDNFLDALADIVGQACARLADDRFAAFVVGDFRGPGGSYRGFPGACIDCFRAAGLALYNEAILITPAGSLPVRVRGQFEHSRKLGRSHQTVQIFVKGDARAATEAIGPVQFSAGEDGEEAGAGAGEAQSAAAA